MPEPESDPASAFDPIDFLERAVQVPSHEDIEAMRDLLVKELAKHGVDATVDDAGNVLAHRAPDGQDRFTTPEDEDTPHVVLNTHIDTVPPHIPYDREEGIIHGRGSCDAKGPLAALLAAFLATEPDEGRVTLAITPDEEVNSTGAHALDLPDVDAYIVGEPTGLDVCTAARGRFQGTITLSGTGAHAAEPQSGTNAVRALEPLLAALGTFDDEHGPDVHPELGSPLLTPTIVEGGEATNRIPSQAEVVIDRRSVPPEGAEEFFAALREHVRTAVPEDVGVAVEPAERDTPFLEAFDTPTDAPVVRALADASGGEVRPFGAATEASYFASEAPTVVFGPGDLADDEGAVAHSEREYVRTSEVEAAADAVEAALGDLV